MNTENKLRASCPTDGKMQGLPGQKDFTQLSVKRSFLPLKGTKTEPFHYLKYLNSMRFS